MNDLNLQDLLINLGIPINTVILVYMAWLYKDVRALYRAVFGNGRKGVLDRIAEIEAACKARHERGE